MLANDLAVDGAASRRDVAGGRDAWVVDGFAPLPGDTLHLPGREPSDAPAVVQTLYLCAESNGVDLVRWSWIVLTDGRLLEVAPRGCALYDPPTVLAHGSGPFLDLAAQDGALVRFEERVRAGVWEARPVRLTLGGRRWRLTSTGTVIARRLGPVPSSAWGQLRTGARPANGDRVIGLAATEDGDHDVYFTFAGQSSGKVDPDTLGLGVWMADICLAFGRRLGDSPAAAGLKLVSAAS